MLARELSSCRARVRPFLSHLPLCTFLLQTDAVPAYPLLCFCSLSYLFAADGWLLHFRWCVGDTVGEYEVRDDLWKRSAVTTLEKHVNDALGRWGGGGGTRVSIVCTDTQL